MTTIRDVARVANVAVSTVSLAFNRRSAVSDTTYERVMAAADEIGYVANPLGKNLRTGRSNLISIVMPDFQTEFTHILTRELEKLAYEQGYLVTISAFGGERRDSSDFIQRLIAQRVSGMLLAPSEATAKDTQRLVASGISTVLIDRELPGAPFDFVGVDNQEAMRLLVAHLVELGHRRIGFIGGAPGVGSSEPREAGFRLALSQHGLSVGECHVQSRRYDEASGFELALEMLSASKPPTALIAVSAEVMVGVMAATDQRGLRTPEDISLCCCDDGGSLQWMRPRLTHLRQPFKEMTVRAAEWLLERVENKSSTVTPRKLELKPELILGESCARPRAG